MEFIKTVWKNKKLVWGLGRNDFRNRFASTSLGSIWGFLQPFIYMVTYVIVFQFILKTPAPGDYPYAVWFLPGLAMWLCLNDTIVSASNSIRAYSYLVKKVVFPVDTIPIISIISSSFVSIFLILISIVVSAIYGFLPNVLMLIYILFAAFCFIIAFTRLTSAITTLVPDFSNLLGILMQLFFWFTPIIWNLGMLSGHETILTLVQCIPFTYLVTGIRDVFLGGDMITQSYGLYTIVFWVITILIFLWGNYIFKKNKKDFADVL